MAAHQKRFGGYVVAAADASGDEDSPADANRTAQDDVGDPNATTSGAAATSGDANAATSGGRDAPGVFGRDSVDEQRSLLSPSSEPAASARESVDEQRSLLSLSPASARADDEESGAESMYSTAKDDDDGDIRTGSKSGGHWRWAMAMMAMTLWLVTYADRTNISLAIVEMEKEFGWSDTENGLVLSSFFSGYLLTQVLGGWAAARFSGHVVLGLAVLSYSAATLLTPLAAASSFYSLIACRIVLGMGEGLTLPALHHVTARWTPVHERSRFVTISVSGQYLGTSITLLCAPMVSVWWPSIFYLFGCLGVLWVVVWAAVGADSATKHRYISAEERAYIAGSVPPLQQVDSVPWRKLCCEPAFIAVYVAHFTTNWANFFSISWLPKYLVDVVGLSLEESGVALMLPYIMPFFGVLVAGQVSDALIKRGWKVVHVRKTMQALSEGVQSMCIMYFVVTPEPTVGVFTALMAVAGFFKSLHIAGYWTNIVDIGPRYAGPLMGLSNTSGALAGVLANLVTGFLLDATGSWQLVFAVFVAVQLFGCAVFVKYARGDVIFH